MFQFEPTSLETRSEPIDGADEFLGRANKGTAVIVSTRGRPDIVQSLVKQLGEQETRLDVVRKELATLEAARQKAQADLAVFIEGFSGAS